MIIMAAMMIETINDDSGDEGADDVKGKLRGGVTPYR